ncbi:PAS domain S-box protein [Sunxiuqinia dokdonensis]|uniref:Sensory/regulatory protein RpfC n=1 Tax=Sunxiuqinia dokdonensis TaxID=1409788 RepID=A0A0L8VCE3_9BACT|nr:PAS domain S-box protein [Sunxiuqinia dokdonensis]KOH46033.1 histidine kinase [Sunxiuqinia dokdonensis]
MITDLLLNSSLLIALTVLYSFLFRKLGAEKYHFKVIAGLLFGAITIIGMNMPVRYEPGIIYDGRSIVLSLAGLFGGGIVSAIAALLALIYRLYLGGAGIWAGGATIVISALTGLIFRRLYKNKPENISRIHLLLMGVMTHIGMLLSQLLLPWESAWPVISQIWIPVLLIFPGATLLMGLLLRNEVNRIGAETKIRESETRYRTTLNSIGDAVITTDNSGIINFMNPIAEQLTGWNEAEALGKPVKSVFHIINESSRNEVACPVEKVLAKGAIVGLANHTLLITRQGNEIPVADSGAPIRDENGDIKGVVLVFRDQTAERDLQRQLQRSERSLKESQEIAGMGHWEFDLRKKKISWSENLYRLFGLEPYKQKASYRLLRSIVHPDDLDQLAHGEELISKRKSSIDIRFRIVTPDGQYKWIMNRIIPEYNMGKLVRLRGINQDITESVETLEALKKSEKGYKNLFENDSAMKLLIDLYTGDIANANRAARKFYGYSRKQMKKMNVSDLFLRTGGGLEQQLTSNKRSTNQQSEYQHKLADGSTRNVKVFTSKIVFKGKIYLHAIVQDITGQKEAESQLQLLSKSTEQSPVSIVITDPDGTINYVNPKFTETSGYTAEEVIGKKPSILKSGRHSNEFYKELWQTVLAGKDWQGEFENRKKNGELFWESAVISSIVDENGKITHLLGAKEDITEKKRITADLQQAKEKAEESDRLKTSFLANMSHEIRTPMNAILGFTNLLVDDDTLDRESKKEFSSILKQSGENLMQIINDILDISKLETGQLTMYPREVEINRLLQDLHLMFQQRLIENEKSHIQLRIVSPNSNIQIRTDQVRFSQIFMNLLSNAVKFTNAGEICFGIAELTDEQISFFVSDTGIGIKPEKQESIFDRFRQAEESFSRNYGGTGLGLSISKKIVELMGGNIQVQSEVGKGTTFSFRLPFNRASETAKE